MNHMFTIQNNTAVNPAAAAMNNQQRWLNPGGQQYEQN